MKLITYAKIATQKKMGIQRKKDKDNYSLRLYKSTGIITFSTPLVKALKIEKYFSVTIHQDAENEDNWYIEFGGGDYTIYEINNHSLGFSCSQAVSDFFEHFLLAEGKVMCKMAIVPNEVEGKKLYRIDTVALRKE